ncbi:MAG TPA: OmpA family protein [Smithella sp.]|nr:OmpA family protein [Smithella sp.]HNY50932.1 OmpA family protein [Smithella sp.]HOG90984.1 OmpA family protein [Smithella sp.]HOU52007.1 OmpA family protein [Smithella sp.]HQG66428.1 OmpA family protein [Smithella sp.]
MMRKKTIKYVLIVFLLLPLFSLADAQEYKGIKGIYLQDGTAVEGQIIFMSADVVKIRSKDGNVCSYSFIKDVESFIREGDVVESNVDSLNKEADPKDVRAGGLPEIKIDKNISDCGSSSALKKQGTAATPCAPAPIVESKPEPVAETVLQAAPVNETVTITLNVEFDANKTIVQEKYYEDIKRVADFLKEHPDATAAIEGHTDNIGNDAFNKSLSERRANNVRQYIIDKFGIDGQRITAAGFGEEVPVADNATVEGRQKNRRVEAVIEMKK